MTRASLIAVLLLIIGVILLGWFLIRIIRRLTFQPIAGKPRRPPGGVSYFAIFVAVVLLTCSWVLFWVGHQLKTFKPFSPPGMIGKLELVNEKDPIKSLYVKYYSALDDSLSKPTSFYLSGNAWGMRGQYVKIPGFLKPVFLGQHFYKVTDFYGDFIGHRPPGIESPLLAHQTIEGGWVDFYEYISIFPFIKDNFQVRPFSHPAQKLQDWERYEIALTDSGEVSLIEAQ
jgi:hypothetical protein